MMFVVIIVIVLVLNIFATGLIVSPLRADAVDQARGAAAQLRLPVVAGLVQFKLLLLLQIAANIGVFAVGLAALIEFFILLFVKRVYLVIESGSHLFTRVG
ncbi:MAG TPA: hypothetical protein VFB79_17035 [Candidatus Angelobacter sp.]|nr:hypothetical protein [Candidatus Angelobacter sp.]